MVKIGFARKTIQLWPEKYKGVIKINQHSVGFTNPKGVQIQIRSPIEWNEENGAPINDLLLLLIRQEKQQISRSANEKYIRAQEVQAGTNSIDFLKERLEEITFESFDLLKRRVKEQLQQLKKILKKNKSIGQIKNT